MYDLCLNPEVARQISSEGRENELPGQETDRTPKPEVEKPAAETRQPVTQMTDEERYAVAFELILHWSKYGGC